MDIFKKAMRTGEQQLKTTIILELRNRKSLKDLQNL